MSNIRQIIKLEFNEALGKEILPKLETQIGEMLKDMQEVNFKVCSELQQSLKNEEQRSQELIGRLNQAAQNTAAMSQQP